LPHSGILRSHDVILHTKELTAF